ncbi:ribulose-phosphate 3-epimerase [Clostridium thermarum]|uniref:ribulose-phosphate 3-epimerase n=1 Tax=Clostridium thermarum TaxID=1716543 RepID=UPI0013D0FE8E|nr:ribulose-phosphate 3-epimerase [Clostridium thermarum]
MIKLAPSILSADFAKLGEQVALLEKAKVDLLHIDVMDGNFVPNISIGLPVIKSLRPYTTLPFDVHLMIEKPSRYIEDFVKAGADYITVHQESEIHTDRLIDLIKSFQVKAGVSINPATPVSVLEHLLPKVDLVLIMSVNPGFGGQSLIEYTLDKVKALKEIREKHNYSYEISIDGGVTLENCQRIAACGADILVSGSSIFKNNAIEDNVKEFRALT